MINRFPRLGTKKRFSGYMWHTGLLQVSLNPLVLLLVASLLQSTNATAEKDADLVFDEEQLVPHISSNSSARHKHLQQLFEDENDLSSEEDVADVAPAARGSVSTFFFGWLGGSEEVPSEEPPSEPSSERSVRVVRETARRRVPRQTRNDDEDFDNSGDGLFNEGSGLTTEIIPGVTSQSPNVIPGRAYYYRVTLHVNEPFKNEFLDRNSEAFRNISSEISEAVLQLYTDLPGRRTCRVLQIKGLSDRFFSYVMMDLGTLYYYDTDVLRDRLTRQVVDMRRLGSMPLLAEGFTFTAKGVGPSDPIDCAPGETHCRNGECFLSIGRCNGVSDCSDGSDELGCTPSSSPRSAFSDTTSSSTRTYPPTASVTTTPYEAVPVPVPPPRTECRADDFVRCSDGTATICSVQICDGKPDCPDGGDERECSENIPACKPGEVACDNKCVPKDKKCDYFQDCTNGEDENNCDYDEVTPPVCSGSEYTCSDGKTCVSPEEKCDGRPHCPDGDDEHHCGGPTTIFPTTSTPSRVCDSRTHWQCNYGECIEIGRRCNGVRDCPQDNSDELNCANCINGVFICCCGIIIPPWQLCDAVKDCSNRTVVLTPCGMSGPYAEPTG